MLQQTQYTFEEDRVVIEAQHQNMVPVAGHCLGSPLVALALGGEIYRHDRPEIGWCEIMSDNSATACEWWGEHAGQVLQTFQWHGDTFEPPTGAVPLARGRYCGNQAFVLRDLHLLVQSHLELTPSLVELSLARNGQQLVRQNALANPAASAYHDLLNDLPQRTARMRVLLKCLYTRWAARCMRP